MADMSAPHDCSSSQSRPTQQAGDLTAQYSDLISAWGSHISARNMLQSGYLIAHSFLIASTVFLFLELPRQELIWWAVVLFSVVGLVLAFQMGVAWLHSLNLTAIFVWHLRRIEKSALWEGPHPFTDWEALRVTPLSNLISSADAEDQIYANWATKHCRSWWAPRAKIIPFLLAAVYLFFLVSTACTLLI